MPELKILIAGGGTGGHLFPALAIGEEIHKRNPNAKIHYVGSKFGLEARVFPIKDVWHTLLPIRGFQRGINFQSILRNSLLPFRIIKSMLRVKSLMKEFLPQVVIGTGGYASALPLYYASSQSPSPPIILQEQNSYPGITTRWFAKKSKIVCIAFKDATAFFDSNTVLTGNPVRQGISNGDKINGIQQFNLENHQKTIFVFGGSQGSSYLNKMVSNVAKNIAGSGIQILWQTGDQEYSKYKSFESGQIRIVPFIHNMADAYAIADLIICRSGALTLAEITVCGKPAILIPFSYAAGDHQTKNAQSLVDEGAARILFETTLNTQDFLYSIMNLIKDNKELLRMSDSSRKLGKPNATNEIVDHILEVAK